MHGARIWASLPYQEGITSHRALIEEWYYSGGVNDHTGDIPCASFELVYCVRVGLEDTAVVLDVAEQDPYERTFYIVYRVHGELERVHVLGGFHWCALKPSIPLAELVHSRAFLALYDADESATAMKVLPQFFFPTASAAAVSASVDTDVLRWRLDWYMGLTHEFYDDDISAQDDLESFQLSTLIEQLLEVAYSLPGSNLNMTTIRERFHVDFLRCEYARFMARCEPFCHDEQQMMELLVFNGYASALRTGGLMIFPPPPRDLQVFARHWPSRKPPTCFFRVPVVDLPQHVAMMMPLYAGGTTHISYLDVPAWIWNVFTIQQQRLAFEATNPAPHPELKYDITRVIQFYMMNTTALKHRAGAVAGTNRANAIVVEPRVIITVESDAELISFMPPCFRRIMEGGFMKHLQRLHWLHTLRFAGVSYETVRGFLERSNAAHPAGHKTAKLRFDYDYAWNKKGNTGPTFCANIVQNTDHATTITCPYAADVRLSGARDIEDLADGCRSRCAPGQRPFKGPAAIIMRNIYRSGRADALLVTNATEPAADMNAAQEGYKSPFESEDSSSAAE